MRRWLWVTLLLSLCWATEVSTFSPQGSVYPVEQATARFSAPVVALGDNEAESPFEVDCPAGSGRWLSPWLWVYDFKEPLPGGIRCSFTLREGLSDQKGEALEAATFTFDTGGPRVIDSLPKAGAALAEAEALEPINENPTLLLAFSAPLDPKQLSQKSYFSVAGSDARVGVEVLSNLALREFLAGLGKRNPWSAAEEAQTLVGLRPQQALPSGARVELILEPGLASVAGVASQKPEQLAWRVREPFSAQINCTRFQPGGDCLPGSSLTLQFSAPLAREAAQAIRIVVNEREQTPEPPAGDWATSLRFPPPFPAESLVRVQIPAGLQDQDGRPLANAEQFPLEVKVGTEPPLASFTPLGSVYPVEQVTARFNTHMVPFGDPDPEPPFEIDCLAGSGRWVSPWVWVYDFEEPLPGGIRCSFAIRDGLTDLEGAPIPSETYQFDTGGPLVVDSRPSADRIYERAGDQYLSRADENQIFALQFNSPPDPASLVEHGYFVAEGLEERLPLEIVPQAELAELLKAAGEGWFLRSAEEEKYTVIGVRARRSFPNGARVELVLEPGLSSPSGVARSDSQRRAWRVRQPFQASVNCDNYPSQGGCRPDSRIWVEFSAPIQHTDAVKLRLLVGQEEREPTLSDDEWVNSVSFEPSFPEESVLLVTLPDGIQDDAGRSLTNQSRFPFQIQIGIRPPLAQFPGSFGILESKADPVLPVMVRRLEPTLSGESLRVDPETAENGFWHNFWSRMPWNREQVAGQMSRITAQNLARDQADGQVMTWMSQLAQAEVDKSLLQNAGVATTRLEIPNPAPPQETAQVGIPLAQSGFYLVELASGKFDPKGEPRYVRTGVLVTDLAVHLKIGSENSLVWVTTLSQAKPVAGAQIDFRDCRGSLLYRGETGRDGVMAIPQSLSQPQSCPRGLGSYFVSARKGEDFSFALSQWVQGIEPWRFDYYDYDQGSNLHTVFDRTLLRAGETVHMAHVLREPVGSGFAFALPPFPNQAVIYDPRGSKIASLPLTWQDGLATSDWEIPREAGNGLYRVEIGDSSAQFRVEEFRVPLLRANLEVAAPVVGEEKFKVSSVVRFLAGGAAGGLPATLRWQVRPRPVYFDDYPEFSFDQGPVQGTETEATEVASVPLNLDGEGTASTEIGPIPTAARAQRIELELEYPDPNGEIQTAARTVEWWPAELVLGIKAEDWVASTSQVNFSVVALDTAGQPQSGVEVVVDYYREEYISHRRRLLGGFYGYQSEHRIEPLGEACRGTTDERGLIFCTLKTQEAGDFRLEAKAGSSISQAGVWVAGEERWWFEAFNSDRMDLIPERIHYQPGETARFQAQIPFGKARVLLTSEREGVLDYQVVELDSKNPTLELPVLGNYAPNVYVTALAVRGREKSVAPSFTGDLGKPSFKIGMSEIQVGWREHELKVTVEPAAPVYPVRGQAQVKVKVQTPDGQAPPVGSKVIFAAVDEGLLELAPNDSWDLLTAMMGHRAQQVSTATAMAHVIGQRDFGSKGEKLGGGGGFASARELFDTLLYWQAPLELDAQGEATVSFPMLDSLTSYTLVAVATAGADRFGTGQASIRTSQDLMIFSGVTPRVRQDDSAPAHFTVRNSSENPVELELGLELSSEEPLELPSFAPQKLTLAPDQSQTVTFPLAVPKQAQELSYLATARIGGEVKDQIRIKQEVVPVFPVRVVQESLLQLKEPLQLAVTPPENALPQTSALVVGLSPRLGGDLASVHEYFSLYPYTCLEQQTSASVVLGTWSSVAARLPAYQAENGLFTFWPTTIYNRGSDVLTSYILSLTNAAGAAIPPPVLNKALDGLERFATGKLTPDSWSRAPDEPLRRLAAIAALSRYNRATPAMLESFDIELALLPTSSLLDYREILTRVKNVPNREDKLAELDQALRARLYLSGTQLVLADQDGLWLGWLLQSPDATAARALLALNREEAWQNEIPLLTQGLFSRQNRGHWDTTLGNAWGYLAVRDFQEVFEPVAVSGETRASLDGQSQTWPWAEEQGSLEFPLEQPGQLSLEHQGSGAPWVRLSSKAAVPILAPVARGIALEKTLTPLVQKEPGSWHPGDVIRIKITVKPQAETSWLVVDDPVPAGATVLAGVQRSLLAESEEQELWPSHTEQGFGYFRAYYQWAPQGEFSIEYTIRINQEGTFNLPATRAEAMYAPEIHGELPNPVFEVQP